MVEAAYLTPEEEKSYTMNFACDLIASEIILSASAAPVDDLVVSNVQYDNTSVTLFLSGGTAGNVYVVKIIITTSGGDTITKSFRVYVNAENFLRGV